VQIEIAYNRLHINAKRIAAFISGILRRLNG
jgi:hypothetical protein